MVKLLIGIVTHNSENQILRCLNAIIESVKGLDLQIVLHDNASSDNTVRLVSTSFPKIKIIGISENSGYAKAVNRIALSTDWNYLLVLNPDLYLKPDAIANAVKYADENPDIMLIGAKLMDEDGNSIHSFGDLPTPSMFLYDFSGLRRILPLRNWSSHKKVTGEKSPFPAGYVTGAFMLIKKKAWELAGFMDENFFLYFEDTDWSFRLHKAGGKIYVNPNVVAVHDSGASFGNDEKSIEFKMQCFFESAYKFIEKHYGLKKSRTIFNSVLILAKIKLFLLNLIGKSKSQASERQRLIIRIHHFFPPAFR